MVLIIYDVARIILETHKIERELQNLDNVVCVALDGDVVGAFPLSVLERMNINFTNDEKYLAFFKGICFEMLRRGQREENMFNLFQSRIALFREQV